ncbi:HD-GYP domain-containing protein [Emcibacter sp. SYSU 3D8]|uniref:HD-GYP domain-containing protein n=1 Tax=Emcibacter sp. SYSU 3D8 TaxID=3133969 RepID=UPI0031FEFEF3
MRSVTLRYHDAGVSAVCEALCRGMGLGPDLSARLSYAASLHDIGKIVVPDAIINKPGPLDEAEWAVMRQHPVMGFNILRDSEDITLKVAANAVLYHHECWDGSGYPHGLAGEAIPLEARIVGICDVYHALREARPYRAALQHDHVMGMILEGDGTGRLHAGKFDPEVLAVFRASSDAVREAFDALG